VIFKRKKTGGHPPLSSLAAAGSVPHGSTCKCQFFPQDILSRFPRHAPAAPAVFSIRSSLCFFVHPLWCSCVVPRRLSLFRSSGGAQFNSVVGLSTRPHCEKVRRRLCSSVAFFFLVLPSSDCRLFSALSADLPSLSALGLFVGLDAFSLAVGALCFATLVPSLSSFLWTVAEKTVSPHPECLARPRRSA